MDTQLQQKLGKNTAAFAFDIDGVLVNGSEPIPGARETLLHLQQKGIPYIFLTNSGGVTEKVNLDKLASRLGDVSFDEAQIVQSHTPFRALVDEYKDKTILVLGGHGNNIRDVASAYGFRDVVTSSDLMATDETVHPFPEMTKEHHQKYGKNRRNPNAFGWPRMKIDAILVWSSPRDWCLDLQVTLDLLLSSRGVANTVSNLNGNSSLPNHGYQQGGQPKLYFCNPDFVWSTKAPLPRLAQGAFREALHGLWNHATKGAELQYTICGKPTHTTYQYGERALQDFITANPDNLDGEDVKTVYMIGDNPASDIAGANIYQSQCGYRWKSVLVETGVHRPGDRPAHVPDHTAKDVKEAIAWALADAEKYS